MGLLRSVSKGIAITGAVVAGGALAVTARSVLATPQPLESVLEGEKHLFRSREGDIFYTVSGPAAEGERGGAQPVLLLHSTHLCASSFEWRRNFSALSQDFRVYAPDLLGFGLSDRPATDYSANTYVTFISDFAREVIGRPALVVARGQSATFATRAAYLEPHLFSRLVLISPTGIASGAVVGEVRSEGVDGSQEEHGGSIEALRGILRRVSKMTVGEVPYAFLTTKTALSLFIARQSYAHSEQVTPDLVRYLFATTHQHGARFAPLAFMGGKLDLDVASDFATLQQPALLVWGEQDAINEPLHAEALRRLNPRARLELISSAGNAVQDEQPREINELLRAWFLAPAALVDPSRQQDTPPQVSSASATARPDVSPLGEAAQPISSPPLPEPAAPEASTAAGPPPTSSQAGEATETPAPQSPRPATRATPRRTPSPKAAASRAPSTSGDQPSAHAKPPNAPQQGNGKTPGSRPSGSKKKPGPPAS